MSIKKTLKKLILQKWNIGFITTPVEDILEGRPIEYQWMKHDFKDRWFADPFLLDVTDRDYIVLAEDAEDARGYALLSRLIIDRKTLQLKDVKAILDRGSHLSFPAIIRKGDDIYVYPENSASGELNLYKYNRETEKLVFEKTMIHAPLTDAMLLNYGGEELLFATTLPDPNGNRLDIYVREREGFRHKQTVMVKGRTARMGGEFFYVDGILYRPAQDNNERYGGALFLQRVSERDGNWAFENIRRLTSPHPDYTTGLHTFNTYKGITVVDIHGYRRHPWLSHSLTTALNCFRTRR